MNCDYFQLRASSFFHVGKCDYFIGDWVPNPLGPAYTNESCNLIESHQNCMTNGRPDREFLNWRWVPRDCDLPQFDSWRFLRMMRNKAWALIGDSISRNHVQSLLCMLAKVCVSFALSNRILSSIALNSIEMSPYPVMQWRSHIEPRMGLWPHSNSQKPETFSKQQSK